MDLPVQSEVFLPTESEIRDLISFVAQAVVVKDGKSISIAPATVDVEIPSRGPLGFDPNLMGRLAGERIAAVVVLPVEEGVEIVIAVGIRNSGVGTDPIR